MATLATGCWPAATASCSQDGQPQGRRQGRLGHLGPAVFHLDGALLQQGAHQLGHGVVAEAAKGQAPRSPGVEGGEGLVQLRGPR